MMNCLKSLTRLYHCTRSKLLVKPTGIHSCPHGATRLGFRQLIGALFRERIVGWLLPRLSKWMWWDILACPVWCKAQHTWWDIAFAPSPCATNCNLCAQGIGKGRCGPSALWLKCPFICFRWTDHWLGCFLRWPCGGSSKVWCTLLAVLLLLGEGSPYWLPLLLPWQGSSQAPVLMGS